jgi:DNA-binding NarL/FixJ family response regulator
VRGTTSSEDRVRTNAAGTTGGRIGVALAIVDFPMLHAGYRAVIDAEPDLHVVAEIADEETLDDALGASRPDVLIVECLPLAAPRTSPFGTIEACRAGHPNVRILALETRGGSEQFTLALKAGADGFLSRASEAADIATAIRAVHRGQTYVSPAIVTRMVNTYVLRTPDAPLEDAYATLTEREREVLLLAAVGHTNREIAHMFHLSEQTVHNYRANIMEKLGFHDRVELLKFAIRRGIISVADL